MSIMLSNIMRYPIHNAWLGVDFCISMFNYRTIEMVSSFTIQILGGNQCIIIIVEQDYSWVHWNLDCIEMYQFESGSDIDSYWVWKNRFFSRMVPKKHRYLGNHWVMYRCKKSLHSLVFSLYFTPRDFFHPSRCALGIKWKSLGVKYSRWTLVA